MWKVKGKGKGKVKGKGSFENMEVNFFFSIASVEKGCLGWCKVNLC